MIRLSRVVAIEAKKKQMKKRYRAKPKTSEKQGPAPSNVIRIMSAWRKPVEVENRSRRRQT
ncbi:hypothetical protein ELI41_24800 (plasmid) [Rhizobium leguminosarum]|uniref:Uncharacterized protein n=1 Tax=Rhizobium leguminosarum TaxID=384 RepID=A0ABD7PLF1_RHILE|nr:hypothetical protein ELI41_24800 [Rhizobium leguminosarum]TAV46679.1 hypothetical protein ELI29_27685 [Rhizobium leguminosarum]TAV65013.1 hypothetical protein ELI28_29690 [Rhizobium leguminosarum]TAV65471.1 hypothetical protein ELI27_32225 [Rhizobium leguminosarum]TAW25461.1 hypothetical protein ELI19_28935 [Rhizobium leguminosarum]